VIAGFTATNYPAQDGLSMDEVREALEVFVQQKHLAAIEIAAYNPALDPDGSGARTIVDLIVSALEGRLKFLEAQAPVAQTSAKPEAVKPAPAVSDEPKASAEPEPETDAAGTDDEATSTSGEGATEDPFSEAGDAIPDSDDTDETDGDSLLSDSEDTHS
jgi:Arginase family